MKNSEFTGHLHTYIKLALRGNPCDIDAIICELNQKSSLATTRFVDYALSLTQNQGGIDRIEHYLFNGSLIQRNYCCLFFNRRGDWDIVKPAYEQGLIDEIQAYSR